MPWDCWRPTAQVGLSPQGAHLFAQLSTSLECVSGLGESIWLHGITETCMHFIIECGIQFLLMIYRHLMIIDYWVPQDGASHPCDPIQKCNLGLGATTWVTVAKESQVRLAGEPCLLCFWPSNQIGYRFEHP